MTAITLRVKAADGWPLAATLHLPPGGTARAACLIAPAIGLAQRYYAPFGRWLAGRGVAVFTFDYRGVHASAQGHARDCRATARDWGERDVAAMIAEARDRFPDLPLLLVAQSMGGHLFPLAPNAGEIGRVLTIASQSGYWGLWPRAEHLSRLKRLYLDLPVSARLLGYAPTRARLGADLPAGVALEWARWCRARGYVADPRFGFQHRFADIDRPMICVGFADDPQAPRAAVEAYMTFFARAQRSLVWLSPQEIGVEAVGHFGFFRQHLGAALWPRALDWLGLAAPSVAGRTSA